MTAINRTISINHRQQEVLDEIFTPQDSYGIVMALTGEILAMSWDSREMFEISADGRWDKLMVRQRS